MIITAEGYSATRVTGSGVTNLSSGNVIMGGFFTSSGTVGTVNLYQGTTTGTGTAILASGVTLITGTFVRFPAVSSGLTILVTGWTTPDFTVFWKAAGN